MEGDALVEELIRAAARLGVEVRVEPFETPPAGGGGLCRFQGALLILVDARAPLPDRVQALARALATLESDHVYLMPEVRELLEAARGARGPDATGSSP
jgi:hypothetical protein